LLEWVRDEVLKKQYEKLDPYFPPGRKLGIKDKLKEVLQELEKAGEIPTSPDLGTRTWEEFRELVEFRDALVHATASRPIDPSEQGNESPDMGRLNSMPAGWAVDIIVRLIRDLHTAVGTSPPSWLKD
jgi:hypothetical protein